jgi:hypothetical protein
MTQGIHAYRQRLPLPSRRPAFPDKVLSFPEESTLPFLGIPDETI